MKLDLSEIDLKKVTDSVVNYTLGMDLTWNWPCGVAYYGVSRAFEVTGSKATWSGWPAGVRNI